MQYVGLDVSLKEVAICVVDDEGTIECEGTEPSEPIPTGWRSDPIIPTSRSPPTTSRA